MELISLTKISSMIATIYKGKSWNSFSCKNEFRDFPWKLLPSPQGSHGTHFPEKKSSMIFVMISENMILPGSNFARTPKSATKKELEPRTPPLPVPPDARDGLARPL